MFSSVSFLAFSLALWSLVSAKEYTFTVSGWTFIGHIPKTSDAEMRALRPVEKLQLGKFWDANCREAASDDLLMNLPISLLKQAASGFWARSIHPTSTPGHYLASAPIQYANTAGTYHYFLVEIEYYDTHKGYYHVELSNVFFVVSLTTAHR